MNMRASLICAGMLLLALPAQAANVSGADRRFVRIAMQGALEEIQRAQHMVNSQDPRVTAFAGKMITDHHQEAQTLSGIAADLQMDTGNVSPQRFGPNVEVSAGPAGVNTSRAQAMPATTYFQKEIAAHKTQLALFTREAQTGNPRLRAFAKQQLPILKLHLAMAERSLTAERREKH